jgi:pimeloyl-ACP methyl ester carboxylesterase
MGSQPGAGARAVPAILQPGIKLVNRRLLRPFAESHSPIAGDIIYYQAKGQGIRDFIAGAISTADPPVYVMAHSLGGIAAVETLILDNQLKVAVLVTFGSQAPYFLEIDALAALKKGEALPAHFPPLWLNVCDPNDLLSFRAKTVFANDARIHDEQVDSGQPPVAAHSAYLGSNAFWKHVWKVFP